MEAYKPRISVITIVKNNETQLPQAIESVLNQSFTDFEYIIVNDGSTDKTGELIDTYALHDERIISKHLKHNVGRASARNIGIDLAQGRYLFFLDSDDYLPPSALADLFKVAEEDSVDIVYGRIQAIETETGNIKSHYTDDFINHERRKFRLEEYVELVKNHSIIGRLYKSKFIGKKGIRFKTTRKNGEDVIFSFYTAFYANSISMVPGVIAYCYRIGNFLLNANESKLADARDNILETVVFCKKNGSKSLHEAIQKKAAIYIGNLGRAQRVFGLDHNLKTYIASLGRLADEVSNEVIEDLSGYYQDINNYIKGRNITDAYKCWLNRIRAGSHFSTVRDNTDMGNNLSPNLKGNKPIVQSNELKHRISQQQLNAIHLIDQLDQLYDSTSWKITAPLRWGIKKLRGE